MFFLKKLKVCSNQTAVNFCLPRGINNFDKSRFLFSKRYQIESLDTIRFTNLKKNTLLSKFNQWLVGIVLKWAKLKIMFFQRNYCRFVEPIIACLQSMRNNCFHYQNLNVDDNDAICKFQDSRTILKMTILLIKLGLDTVIRYLVNLGINDFEALRQSLNTILLNWKLNHRNPHHQILFSLQPIYRNSPMVGEIQFTGDKYNISLASQINATLFKDDHWIKN
ncbi:hypothetical protein BpHYR1_035152 [Brachionus plicatilis]|uniref:Uncharacterized protein n=1 Tax=Brachionus plicatilis TaxID=10195 RepID=A0A3M7SEH1_BRAPC|nr:hypothetical protein BpHYR1_035152 [Brachionus plicatilis]